MAVIEIQLEAQRLLLLQLYKQSFLADPDTRSQLAVDLVDAVKIPQHAIMSTCSIEVLRCEALKDTLEVFFSEVEQLVEQVRHQTAELPSFSNKQDLS